MGTTSSWKNAQNQGEESVKLKLKLRCNRRAKIEQSSIPQVDASQMASRSERKKRVLEADANILIDIRCQCQFDLHFA